jgi:hypothetical protein
LFLSGAGRWLGVAVQGEAEQPRIMLVTVPYALKAREADTLAGKTATDFVLTANLNDTVKSALKVQGVSGTTPGILATTVNTIAKFIDTSNGTGDSAIVEVGGNVGIGTASPTAMLDVSGNTLSADGILTLEAGGRLTTAAGNDLNIVAPPTRSIIFKINSTDQPKIVMDNIGRLGVGTATPNGLLDVSGTTISFDGTLSLEPGGKLTTAAGNDLNIDVPSSRSLLLKTGGSTRITMDNAGNLGIGTTTPAAKLHVAGNVTADGNIAAKYQDVAEWVEAPASIEAGTVVIVDPTAPNRVLAASRAYDTRVAGAISRQPGLVLGERSDTTALVAQSGRVRIKADATYGAIKIGDLLVTSPTPGCAMRSRPLKVGGQTLHRPGTLLGKALEALPSGQGEILVLLTLQ